MATVTVNTLEFVSALRALIPISKQATLYSGEKERNAATIAARITPAKKLRLSLETAHSERLLLSASSRR